MVFKAELDISSECRELILGMLCFDEKKRIDFKDIASSPLLSISKVVPVNAKHEKYQERIIMAEALEASVETYIHDPQLKHNLLSLLHNL